MRVMAAKDGVQGRRRLRIFAAAVALVLLCAVCVGGVSGDTYYVPANGSLASVVANAENNSVIIITENYTITQQVVLNSQRSGWQYLTRSITITNAPGVHVTVSSGLGTIPDGTDWSGVDSYTLFRINAGTLTIQGHSAGGSITFTTNNNGRAFDVNYDDRAWSWGGDGRPAALIMNSGVDITNCGFSNSTAESNNGGAVYVRDEGSFTMNGGEMTGNSAGAGGAVYVESGGKFIMYDGEIRDNTAINSPESSSHDGFGGGVWGAAKDCLELNGGSISGNASPKPGDPTLNYNEIYYPGYRPDVDDSPLVVGNVTLRSENREVRYETVAAAYEKAAAVDTIYIDADIYQDLFDAWEGGTGVDDYVSIPEHINITKNITIQPYGQSITLKIRETMFTVKSGGNLTFSGNGGYTLTLIPTESNACDSNGGIVVVDGGIFTLQNGITISQLKAANGGAVYVNSGEARLTGGSISSCTVSGDGAAVYVAGGILSVSNAFSLSGSDDVYLAENQVITVASGYSGSLGNITLSDYTEGRNVVDVTADSDISITKFTLNPEAHNEYGDKLLVHVVEDGKDFLELKTQPVYRITIPDSLHISSEDKYGTMLITAETVKIPINSWLSVTVVSEGNFNLTNTADNSAKLPYNLFIDESGVRVKNNMEVAHFTVTEYLEKQSVSSKLTERLNGTVTELPPVTGTYTDILTFTVEYKTT